MVNFLSLKSNFLNVKNSIGYILIAALYYGTMIFFFRESFTGLGDVVYTFFGFFMSFVFVSAITNNNNGFHKINFMGVFMLILTTATVYAIFELFIEVLNLY